MADRPAEPDSDHLASAEVELLICCARLVMPPETRARATELLATPIDWDCLGRLADRHGLTPLLQRHLPALAPNPLPAHVLAALWSYYQYTSHRNSVRTDELLKIQNLLEDNGIAALPYKGPALTFAIYGDLGLREFGDLDILVPPDRVLDAKALLQGIGYEPAYPLAPHVEAAFLRARSNYHMVMVHPQSSLMVELHWRTDSQFPVESSADPRWWSGLDRAPLKHGSVRCFSSQDLLLILLLHGTKHHWSSLSWLVDVAELIRQHPDVDWPRLWADAKRLRCERRVAVGLLLLLQLLDAPLPAPVATRASLVPGAQKLADFMRQELFREPARELDAFEHLSVNLRLFETPRQRVGHCIDILLRPSLIEWTRWPLPEPLFFLFVPIRLAGLLRKYGSRLVGRAQA